MSGVFYYEIIAMDPDLGTIVRVTDLETGVEATGVGAGWHVEHDA